MARRLMVLATPLALLAVGWAIFYVLKEPPPNVECSPERAPGVEAYRAGLGTCAAFAAVVIGALIARISPTKRTLYALAVCAWLALLYNADDDTFWPHALGAFSLMFVGGQALLAISAIATLAMRRPRAAQSAYLWTSLLLLLPAATGMVASEGVPGLCMS